MYFGMRRSGRKTPVPSHKSFCFRTGEPGWTSKADAWGAGDWSLEPMLGGGVWLNAVDAKNQRKKAQRRVIDIPFPQLVSTRMAARRKRQCHCSQSVRERGPILAGPLLLGPVCLAMAAGSAAIQQ